MILQFIVCFVILYCFLQLSRLSELEEMVAEQDNALAVAAEKYKKSRNEIIKMKKDHEEELNNLKQQMARLTKKVLFNRNLVARRTFLLAFLVVRVFQRKSVSYLSSHPRSFIFSFFLSRSLMKMTKRV